MRLITARGAGARRNPAHSDRGFAKRAKTWSAARAFGVATGAGAAASLAAQTVSGRLVSVVRGVVLLGARVVEEGVQGRRIGHRAGVGCLLGGRPQQDLADRHLEL